jgi:hypothetical protein
MLMNSANLRSPASIFAIVLRCQPRFGDDIAPMIEGLAILDTVDKPSRSTPQGTRLISRLSRSSHQERNNLRQKLNLCYWGMCLLIYTGNPQEHQWQPQR